jgi:hypothetical protein
MNAEIVVQSISISDQMSLLVCLNVVHLFLVLTTSFAAIVKHRTKTPGHLGHLHVAAYDPAGKHVLIIYHPPPLHPDIRLEVPFNPIVKSTAEVRPRMMQWGEMAINHYNIVRSDLVHQCCGSPLIGEP